MSDPPLSEGRPPVLTRPTRRDPQPVVAWPGWAWWHEDGMLHAACAEAEVQAHNFTALLNRIRKVQGGTHGGPDRTA